MHTHYPEKQIISQLIIESDLCLQTLNAQRYVWGMNKNALGLFAFSRIIKEITKAASLDNPYADWFLLRLHDAISQARYQLQRFARHYDENLKAYRSGRRKVVFPVTPQVITLRFSSAYSFLAADMLSDFDAALSLILTAKFSGFSLDKPFDILQKQLNQLVEPVLNLPSAWKNINVTRLDVQQNTETAQRAFAGMGKLPEAVLNNKIRAPFAPTIKNTISKINHS